MLRFSYCLLAGRDSSLYYLRQISAGTPEGQLEQASATGTACKGSPRLWNASRAILYCLLAGDNISVLYPPSGPMIAEGLWNARRAIGTGFSPWNSPQSSPRPGTPQGYFVLFVGRRYYLRQISPGTREGQLERAKRIWTARRALSGYSCITRVRVCDGNAMRVR